MRRHDLQNVDRLRFDVSSKTIPVCCNFKRYDVQATAGGQRRKDARIAQVGGKARDCRVMQRTLLRSLKFLDDKRGVISKTLVSNSDSFRLARRAGGVHHVAQITRTNSNIRIARPLVMKLRLR